jgi:1-acyl-sn-glycerol-3-phosphate acyltransferase
MGQEVMHMASPYGASRQQFTKVLEAYLNYVALYKLFNGGSIEGVTPFNVFYWRMTYHVRYENSENISRVV